MCYKLAKPSTWATLLAVLAGLGNFACHEAVEPPHRSTLAEAPPLSSARQQRKPRAARSSQPRVIDDGSVRFAVISDLNASYGSQHYSQEVRSAVDRIIELAPDLVLCTGDMVAGQASGLDYAAMWEVFHHEVGDPLFDAGLPFAMAPGNHDASAFPEFSLERLHYRHAWKHRLPELAFVNRGDFPLHYAFLFNDHLFVALDLTTPSSPDPSQLRWLQEVLAAHPKARSKTVFGHLPLHPFSREKYHEFIKSPQLETLLQEHAVALYLSGHHHVFYPARRGSVTQIAVSNLGDGVRSLVNGTPSRRTLLLTTIYGDGQVELEPWVGPGFRERLVPHALPPQIGVAMHRLTRVDWSPRQESLEELERAAYQRAWSQLASDDAAARPQVLTAAPLLPLEELLVGQ